MATTPAQRIKVRQPVRDWFLSNPGIVIHGAALANELGMPEHQMAVLTACSQLAATGEISKAGRKGQYICTTPSRSHKRQSPDPIVQQIVRKLYGDQDPSSVNLPVGTLLTVIQARTADGYQLALCEENRLWKLVQV